MNNEKVIEILKNEIECVIRADRCDRDCARCDLVKESDEIIEALNCAVQAVKDAMESEDDRK